ncbi:MAG TPA: Rossmann-like and DUF2520 domain-containing protein [Longimicrobiales bacterium]|nr:Rossmann-like and DUF2520 domain-containing protein [Longimicrobiales bacterium]
MNGESSGLDNVVIIGPGRMGLALGAAFRHRDVVDRLTYFGRAHEPPPHPLFDPHAIGGDVDTAPAGAEYHPLPALPPQGTTIVILAVPDDALPEVVHDLAMVGQAPSGCVALHLSGALSTDALAPLHHRGYAIGSMHPLMAVADPWLAGERLVGAAFAMTGEPGANSAARRLVSALGGVPLTIPATQRPLYHAAAVVASNYLVALTGIAVRMLEQAGVDGDDAVRALLPLLRGTLDNVEHLGVRAAVTGPIARGDVDTVRLHLARLSPEDRVLYSGLGLELLRLARAAGLDEGRAAEIESLLTST